MTKEDGWIPLHVMLQSTRAHPWRAKIGFSNLCNMGLLEKRRNGETNEDEYRVTPKGASVKLSFKNLIWDN